MTVPGKMVPSYNSRGKFAFAELQETLQFEVNKSKQASLHSFPGR